MDRRRAIVTVLSAAAISACQTTMVPIANTEDEPLHVSVAVGDTVRILTKHGDRLTFELTDITLESLVGDDHIIRYDEMAFVEKRVRGAGGKQSSPTATTAMLIIIGSLVVLGSLGTIGAGFPAPGNAN